MAKTEEARPCRVIGLCCALISVGRLPKDLHDMSELVAEIASRWAE
jgi:hypothetical protein